MTQVLIEYLVYLLWRPSNHIHTGTHGAHLNGDFLSVLKPDRLSSPIQEVVLVDDVTTKVRVVENTGVLSQLIVFGPYKTVAEV